MLANVKLGIAHSVLVFKNFEGSALQPQGRYFWKHLQIK